MKEKIEIQRELLLQIVKNLRNDIKLIKQKLEHEVESTKGICYSENWDRYTYELKAQLEILIQQKIKHEKWRKMLKHRLEEENSNKF